MIAALIGRRVIESLARTSEFYLCEYEYPLVPNQIPDKNIPIRIPLGRETCGKTCKIVTFWEL